MPQGTLFTEDFLNEGIRETDAWHELPSDLAGSLRARLGKVFTRIANPARLNESQTEDRVIQPIFEVLNWVGCYSVQERIEAKGRASVPDYLLFSSTDAFNKADRKAKAADRYPFGVAVADAKAWSLGLDQRGAGAAGDETPSGQIIRYLTRADVQSDGKVLWGILTNGRHWRLYWQRAKSRLEDYFEIDLAWVLDLKGSQGELGVNGRPAHFASDQEWSDHLLKLFWLMFRREAFLPGADGRTFHQLALDEGRNWETKVREDLTDLVFKEVFPDLLRALVRADPKRPAVLDAAYLGTLRDAALTLLYRLLFALYAEDRELLPKRDPSYGGLSRLRDEIAERIDSTTTLSRKRTAFANDCMELFRAIDEGDEDIGLPPYNGGLFSDRTAATELLDRALLPDADFAPLLDRIARTDKGGRRVRINFRDLSVQQLGSIYEGLLEHEPVADPGKPHGIAVRLNPFARKTSGSYYTHDDLVSLIVARTVGPLIDERVAAFNERAQALAADRRRTEVRLDELRALDPAERILDLKIVDPAMGSGHFLLALVDYLADKITTAMGEARETVTWGDYASPLAKRLANVRDRINAEAKTHRWAIREDQLVDKNLVRRFILKRCVYGVDKNPMAVELAKVALWLHTFTAGAPLSFLDHHLQCGDSLYGTWVRKALDALAARGPLLISDAVRKAEGAIAGMESVEQRSDADIAEVQASARDYAGVAERTRPLQRFLDFWQAKEWLETDDARVLSGILAGSFGDPLSIVTGQEEPHPSTNGLNQQQLDDLPRRMAAAKQVIEKAHALAAEERFLHWQIAFPGVWRNWTSAEPEGGFDAVIGNPPWDRMKMQEVEWFAARAPEVAHQQRAADRKRLIERMRNEGDELIDDYERASARAEKAMELARKGGDYPLLSKGDVNIYSLFVERAQALIRPDGLAGLLVPSGILSDAVSEAFMKSLIIGRRFVTGIDFFNKRNDGSLFFPDVYYRFKFCVFIASGPKRRQQAGTAAFFVRDVADLADHEFIEVSEKSLAEINPGRFLLPIIKDAREVGHVANILQQQGVQPLGRLPVNYTRMFDMGTDSEEFSTIAAMEAAGSYPRDASLWRCKDKDLVRLFEGKMVQAFDHRAASLSFYKTNIFRTGEGEWTAEEEHADPSFLIVSRFYVELPEDAWKSECDWAVAFKDITSTTNTRSMIAALIPRTGSGHTLPILFEEKNKLAHLLCGNLNAFALDFVARTRIQGNHLTWHLVKDLPVIKPDGYARRFGKRTAADIVKNHVLRLTYTAHDMAAFARDMGYVDKDGSVKPPIVWNEAERRHLRARLDALYFILYGITEEDDIGYILSTFPIVERKDREAFDGVYLTRELILWYKRALEAGDPDASAPEADLIRLATMRAAAEH